jgi:putative tricarboxylic transport membrane protein
MPPPWAAPPRAMADIVSGLLFVVLSGAIYLIALQLPDGRGNAPGPGFFPEMMAVVGVVVGLAICVRAFVALRARAPRPAATVPHRETVGDVVRLAMLLAVSVAYVVGLRPLGFLVASTTFLALSLLILGERRILILLLVPAGLTGGVLFIFTSLLGLRLPAGTLF